MILGTRVKSDYVAERTSAMELTPPYNVRENRIIRWKRKIEKTPIKGIYIGYRFKQVGYSYFEDEVGDLFNQTEKPVKVALIVTHPRFNHILVMWEDMEVVE